MKMDEIAGLLVDRAVELMEDSGYPLIPFEQDHLYDAFLVALDYIRDNLVEDEMLTGEDHDSI